MFKRCLSTKSLHCVKECYRQLDICFTSTPLIRLYRTHRTLYIRGARDYRSGHRAGLRTQRNKACEILGVTLGIPKINGKSVAYEIVSS